MTRTAPATKTKTASAPKKRSTPPPAKKRDRPTAVAAVARSGSEQEEMVDAALEHESTDDLLRRFRVLFSSVRRHFKIIEQRCGISGSQLWALACIHERPGSRVTEVGRRLSIHQTTASNLIELLVRKGLVERRQAADDGRAVALHCTSLGRRMIAKAPRPFEGILPDALARLPEQRRIALASELDALLAVMSLRIESASGTPLADL